MKAKKKIKKVLAEKDIVQLSGPHIINNRIAKCAKDLGEFKPEEICKKCKFCKWYALAKTPFDSKYRQMDAWESYVSENCPCEYLNGIENEDGEVELLKGMTDASECENFELAENRVPQILKEIIATARKSTYPNEYLATDENIAISRKDCREELDAINLQIEQFKLKINELKSRKEDVEEELSECCIHRFDGVEALTTLNATAYGQIVGERLLAEIIKSEQDAEKLKALGFTPKQKKIETLVISVTDIEYIQRRSSDNTYGGKFTEKNEQGLQVDKDGNTLDYYAGKKFEFETELVEVAKSKGFMKQVIFQETEENFAKRQGISILDLVCGSRKMRWREVVQIAPTIENLNEIDENESDEEVAEGEEND